MLICTTQGYLTALLRSASIDCQRTFPAHDVRQGRIERNGSSDAEGDQVVSGASCTTVEVDRRMIRCQDRLTEGAEGVVSGVVFQ